MPKVYGETARLVLRDLERHELPRIVEFLDTWDIAQWLVVLPHPYTMKDAEDYYSDMDNAAACGEPKFFALSCKTDGLLIGGVGLDAPRGAKAPQGQLEIGYWLARPYWGRGFMSEAAKAVVEHAFARPSTTALSATTSVNNVGSQNVLRKLGLRNMGEMPRDYEALRGDPIVAKWLMTREEWKNYTS